MYKYCSERLNYCGVNEITSSKNIPTIYSNEDYETSLIKGGIIHHEVRSEIQKIIKPGLKLSELADKIESTTRNLTKNIGLNNGIGFPPSLSVSNCTAHYTPYKNHDVVLNYDDNIKIDFGVVVNGWIVDSAFSVYFDPKYENLHLAVEEATKNGIKNIAVDGRINEWGNDNREVMESYEIELDGNVYPIKSIKNLGGHNILKNRIHGGEFLPVYDTGYDKKFSEQVYAIETFGGIDCESVYEKKLENSIYMMDISKIQRVKDKPIKKFVKKIQNKFFTIPFCERYLENINDNYKDYCNKLVNLDVFRPYPPFYSKNGKMTAQYEHTVILKENSKNIISKFEDY